VALRSLLPEALPARSEARSRPPPTFRLVDATNRYVTLAAPWDLVRDGQTERAAVVLRTSLEALHVIACELAPFLPATSDELRTRLQAPALGGETRWNVLPTGARLRRGGRSSGGSGRKTRPPTTGSHNR
jgi:methionyl-tRNA synthetase